MLATSAEETTMEIDKFQGQRIDRVGCCWLWKPDFGSWQGQF
jgi:hypothetical protein